MSKEILITGGSTGISAATAVHLANENTIQFPVVFSSYLALSVLALSVLPQPVLPQSVPALVAVPAVVAVAAGSAFLFP